MTNSLILLTLFSENLAQKKINFKYVAKLIHLNKFIKKNYLAKMFFIIWIPIL